MKRKNFFVTLMMGAALIAGLASCNKDSDPVGGADDGATGALSISLRKTPGHVCCAIAGHTDHELGKQHQEPGCLLRGKRRNQECPDRSVRQHEE